MKDNGGGAVGDELCMVQLGGQQENQSAEELEPH